MLLALTVMWGSAFFFTKLALASVSSSVVVAGGLLIALGVLGAVIAIFRSRLPKSRTLCAYLVAIAIAGNVLQSPCWMLSPEETCFKGSIELQSSLSFCWGFFLPAWL